MITIKGSVEYSSPEEKDKVSKHLKEQYKNVKIKLDRKRQHGLIKRLYFEAEV